MSRIVRAICNSNSFDDKVHHRVRVTSNNVFSNLEVDNLNGIYLREGDEVYVSTDTGDWYDALILGRCSGQLELQQLVDVLNKIIDVLNEDKKSYDGHSHTVTSVMKNFFNSIVGTATVFAGLGLEDFSTAVARANARLLTDSGTPDKTFVEKLDNVKCDDLLH